MLFAGVHQFQMADATIQNATVTFLREGKFPAIEKRHQHRNAQVTIYAVTSFALNALGL